MYLWLGIEPSFQLPYRGVLTNGLRRGERNTGFEPVTSNLEGWRSTTELIPHETIINYLSQTVKCR
jgi:hypothetical protein